MSKSTGDFLTLQALVDRGYHPLAYRLMCLQAHYRSELEFTWEGLGAALTRLKRMVMAHERWRARQSERSGDAWHADSWQRHQTTREAVERFGAAVRADLNTVDALTVFEEVLALKKIDHDCVLSALLYMDLVLGLGLATLTRADLRVRPADARIDNAAIEDALARRKAARADKDFATSDAIRDQLAAAGVEVMDGDPLGWDWSIA